MFLGNSDDAFEPQGTYFAAVAEACGAQTWGGNSGHEPGATLATQASAAQERRSGTSAWAG
jgi:hypothetical protein